MTAVLGAGCPSKSFEHGGQSAPSDSVGFGSITAGPTATVTDSGGIGDESSPNRDGNYPDPAVTRCGDVAGDMSPINGLTSAWAVVAVPGATMDGTAVEAGSVLLRISTEVIRECGDAPEPLDFFGGSGTGTGTGSDTTGGASPGIELSDRGLELMLAPDELTLGPHAVADLAEPRVTLLGRGATSDFGAEASIEFVRVDDDCMIGFVHGFESDTGLPFMEGGFVAQTCQRQCLPSGGNSC